MKQPHRRRALSTAVVVLAALALSACAAGSRAGIQDQDRITQEELERADEADLLSAVRRLRPRWLRTRGSATFGGQVYAAVLVDDMRQPEGLGALRNIRVTDVLELEYLSAADATTRYGTDMAGGAILIRMRR